MNLRTWSVCLCGDYGRNCEYSLHISTSHLYWYAFSRQLSFAYHPAWWSASSFIREMQLKIQLDTTIVWNGKQTNAKKEKKNPKNFNCWACETLWEEWKMAQPRRKTIGSSIYIYIYFKKSYLPITQELHF